MFKITSDNIKIIKLTYYKYSFVTNQCDLNANIQTHATDIKI
jgi:hypothetical protein